MNRLKFLFVAGLMLVCAGALSAQSCSGNKAQTSCCAAKAKAACSEASAATDTKAATVTDGALTTTTFAVSGNCGMCKRTIETAATSVTGVASASWDADKQTITVSYDPEQAAVALIKAKIAASGYDTQGIAATDEAYDSLHGCCKYERVKL